MLGDLVNILTRTVKDTYLQYFTITSQKVELAPLSSYIVYSLVVSSTTSAER